MKEGRDLERKLSPRLKNLKEKTQYSKAPKGNELTLATPLNRVDSKLTVKREMTIDSHVTRAPLIII